MLSFHKSPDVQNNYTIAVFEDGEPINAERLNALLLALNQMSETWCDQNSAAAANVKN